jgi:hypothetical protein
MTNTARIDRALRTNPMERWSTVRFSRRLRSDPHVLLALALVITTVLVDVLDHGPDELAIAVLGLGFLLIQVGLAAAAAGVRRDTDPILESTPVAAASPDPRWAVSRASGTGRGIRRNRCLFNG